MICNGPTFLAAITDAALTKTRGSRPCIARLAVGSVASTPFAIAISSNGDWIAFATDVSVALCAAVAAIAFRTRATPWPWPSIRFQVVVAKACATWQWRAFAANATHSRDGTGGRAKTAAPCSTAVTGVVACVPALRRLLTGVRTTAIAWASRIVRVARASAARTVTLTRTTATAATVVQLLAYTVNTTPARRALGSGHA